MGDRHTEDRQHGVPDELLEQAAEMDDRLGQRGQRPVDARPYLLGIELIDETGVADEVGEQGGDDPPIANLEALGERADRAATDMAEAGARSRRGGAVGAEHRDLYGTPVC